MVITRKISIYVYEDDKELKSQMYDKIREWSRYCRQAANMIVSHKFGMNGLVDCLKEDIKDKIYPSDVLKDERGMSEQNITYRVLSSKFKGKMPSDIYSCLNQSITSTYKENIKEVLIGNRSIPNYKSDIPMPFSAKALSSLHWDEEDKRFYLTWFGIPMALYLGRDRSNNKSIIDKCLSKEYKLCSSSIKLEKGKMILYLCVDIPKKTVKLKEGKKLYAFLQINTPIVYTVDVPYVESEDKTRVFEIGSAEEFFYRRRQIQEARKRLLKSCKYNTGGKGRKRKLQAVDRYEEYESNYVDTKLHTYSRELVNAAIRFECSEIVLVSQNEKEEKAKNEDMILRNWSYYGLVQKIEYKAKLAGVKIVKQ